MCATNELKRIMGINMEKSRFITNLEKFKWMKTLLYNNHKPGNGNPKKRLRGLRISKYLCEKMGKDGERKC